MLSFFQTILVLFAAGLRAVAPTDTMYVFAYSWSPEFCVSHNTYVGCSTPQYFWEKYFTIHGLWPQYVTTGYPSFCSTEPFNASLIETAIGLDTLVTFWPNVQYADTDPAYPQFWEHEWDKHGTCSGLSQTAYFETAIDLLIHYPTPQLISDNVGGNVSTTDVRNALGGVSGVALQCTGGKYLTGAYRCFGRDTITGEPTVPATCPAEVVKEDTCSSPVLLIQSFP
jgi:ribonuclease T2